MTIAQKLVAADPGNSQWQRDVAVSCWKLAKLGSVAGPIESRRELLQTGLTSLVQQKNANHLPALMFGLIEEFNAALGNIELIKENLMLSWNHMALPKTLRTRK